METKLGINSRGLPIVGSIWEGNPNGYVERFRVEEEEVDRIMAKLSVFRDERWIRGHTWNKSDIVKSWKLISVPGPVDPAAIPDVEFVTRIRHEALDRSANDYEAAGSLGSAKAMRQRAASAAKVDAALDIEERAIKNKTVIRVESLKNLNPGDRACYEMKPLRDFVCYKDQMVGWKYWIT